MGKPPLMEKGPPGAGHGLAATRGTTGSTAVATGQPAEAELAPFDSAGELRDEHERLLAAVDAQSGGAVDAAGLAPALRQQAPDIRTFLARGAASGRWLDDLRERTACQVLLDYWVTALVRAGLETPAARLDRFDAEQLPELAEADSPYVGLEAFHEPRFFFGRESDTRSLTAQVRASPLVVVLGASGSGKSSLVMGGVLPVLTASGEGPPLRVLPPAVPGLSVLRAVVSAAGRSTPQAAAPLELGAEVAALREDPGRLVALLGGEAAAPTVATIDQFEEVFTLSDPGEREALVAALAAVLGAGRGHRVLLVMREEFRSRLVELDALARWLDDGAWYAMRPMTYEELRSAVERPAAMARLRFAPGIVDDLVKKVLGQRAALPLLQFTLRTLWEHRRRNRITWEVYKGVGDPLVALTESADRFIDGLAPQTRNEVRRVLLELVRVDELLEAYRRPVPRTEIERAGNAETPAVLELLGRVDFVRISADGVVELKHEALIRNWQRLVDWIDEKRRQRRARLALTEAAARWVGEGRPDDKLFGGWQLDEAKSATDLSRDERAFVDASAAAAERAERAREEALRSERDQALALAARERRLSRVTARVLGVFVLLGLGLSVAAALSWRANARLQAERDLLQVERDRLQVEMASVKAQRRGVEDQMDERDRQLSVGIAQVLGATAETGVRSPTRIVLYVANEEQRARASGIAEKLRSSRIEVPAIELGPVPQKRSDVQYFRVEDRAEAEQLLKLLSTYSPGTQLSEQPTLAGGFKEKVAGKRFDVFFAQGTLGDVAQVTPPAAGSGARAGYVVVLGNDKDCVSAMDALLGATGGLERALGADFQRSALQIFKGTAQGQEYNVTAYGGELSREEAGRILKRARREAGIPSDAYVQRRSYYRAEQPCDLQVGGYQSLDKLGLAYGRLRSSMPAGPERTQRMGALGAQMTRVASDVGLDPETAAFLYDRGEDPAGRRIAALAAAKVRPDARHLPMVLSSIRSPVPGSAYEQHLALALLSQLEPSLAAAERREALAALEDAWARNTARLRDDRDNAPVARRLQVALRRP